MVDENGVSRDRPRKSFCQVWTEAAKDQVERRDRQHQEDIAHTHRHRLAPSRIAIAVVRLWASNF